jgi:hypothetical protein
MLKLLALFLMVCIGILFPREQSTPQKNLPKAQTGLARSK